MILYKVASLVLKLYVCTPPDEVDIHEDSSSGEYDASLPPSKRPHFEYCPRDISNYITLSLADKSDDSKYGVIVDHLYLMLCTNFQKLMDAIFSISGCRLSKYPWLRYSEKADGGFVSPVFFSHSSSFRSDPGILVNTPLTDFKRALEKLNHHAESLSQNSHSEDGCIHQGNDKTSSHS